MFHLSPLFPFFTFSILWLDLAPLFYYKTGQTSDRYSFQPVLYIFQHHTIFYGVTERYTNEDIKEETENNYSEDPEDYYTKDPVGECYSNEKDTNKEAFCMTKLQYSGAAQPII